MILLEELSEKMCAFELNTGSKIEGLVEGYSEEGFLKINQYKILFTISDAQGTMVRKLNKYIFLNPSYIVSVEVIKIWSENPHASFMRGMKSKLLARATSLFRH